MQTNTAAIHRNRITNNNTQRNREKTPLLMERSLLFPGSARVSRANASPARTFGVSPKQFLRKSPRWRDVTANTRDACATRTLERRWPTGICARQAAEHCGL